MNGAFWIRAGAICGLLAIFAGAFGTHYLKERLNLEPRALATFDTGVRYQMIHALAILIVGVLGLQGSTGTALSVAGWGFLVGIILFSGSLYGLALDVGPRRVLGPITPIGGLAFLVGWVALAVGSFSRTVGP